MPSVRCSCSRPGRLTYPGPCAISSSSRGLPRGNAWASCSTRRVPPTSRPDRRRPLVDGKSKLATSRRSRRSAGRGSRARWSSSSVPCSRSSSTRVVRRVRGLDPADPRAGAATAKRTTTSADPQEIAEGPGSSGTTGCSFLSRCARWSRIFRLVRWRLYVIRPDRRTVPAAAPAGHRRLGGRRRIASARRSPAGRSGRFGLGPAPTGPRPPSAVGILTPRAGPICWRRPWSSFCSASAMASRSSKGWPSCVIQGLSP